MSISATNSNPYTFPYINSSTDGSGVRKLNETKFQNEEKTYLKYSTHDQRNIKVSEKMDENRTIQDYNIPLQQSTPTVKLLKILKSFNETKKTDLTNNKADYVDFTEINRSSEEEPVQKSPDEIGFYIVIDEHETNKDVKKIKKPIDIWQKRINSTYHLGFMKEPGILVNVVV
ncbi:hypothetical protein C0389_05080 [bacterium]|nr:hypothetical protein [bacterium]